MDASGAVYAKVPAGGVPALEAAIAGFPGVLGVLAFDPAQHGFALVDRWGSSDDQPRWTERPDAAVAVELAALSKVVGEVVAFYEVEDGLAMGLYAAWRDGALVRELHFFEGEWSKVAGEPQRWEAPLFAADRVDEVCQQAADDGGDPDAIRAAFAAGALVEGAGWPRPDRMARQICDALRAPSYGFRPWPRRRDALRERDAARRPG